ncbi:response regulator [Pseudoalteromonas denitrificans]|uniref:Response regulator receiver domain-containing protein n=1 Tax=Pseudoalteromonas denitrificans DSM 6059 TaxID=1123010 RepID=A0A1I1PYI8_9GAMM|nr:response regulator [Pseudoalteromonas denitrificans]SFD12678.1 Response regulator receiver domain-containing protein [Pseudoalteromonas denitrificans DSM 6059]
MKDSQTKLLVVDDEPLNITIMREYLEEVYENIEYVTNGFECFEKLKTFKPDIILLDVSMPKMDGYEVCAKLKQDPNLCNITVIFVSARGTSEERMSGFKAGGEDYIVKPYKEDELLLKISKTITYHNQILGLKDQLEDANSVAFEAMTGSSEMGYVAQYLDQLFQLDSATNIMDATLKFMNIFGLAACLRTLYENDYAFGSHQGCITPLEKEVIDLLNNSGRIYKFDTRIQFNFSHINVLVKSLLKMKTNMVV